MRAGRRHLTRYIVGDGIVYRVHKLVDLCLYLAELDKLGVVHNKLIKLVYSLFSLFAKHTIILTLSRIGVK